MKQELFISLMLAVVVSTNSYGAEQGEVCSPLLRKQKQELESLVNMSHIDKYFTNGKIIPHDDSELNACLILACITNDPTLTKDIRKRQKLWKFPLEDEKFLFKLATRWGGFLLLESLFSTAKERSSLFSKDEVLATAIGNANSQCVNWCVEMGRGFTITCANNLEDLKNKIRKESGKKKIRMEEEYRKIESVVSQLPRYRLIMDLRTSSHSLEDRREFLSDSEESESSDDNYQS